MGTIAIIPARYASRRLPGKALLAETGKPLIQHVVESVRQVRGIDRIIVATDDKRIEQAVAAFGGEAVMTSEDHRCGTDRITEAAETLGLADDDIVVNVQGDEPEIPPACVERLVELIGSSDAPMATLATPLPAEKAEDPNKVKVVCGADGAALYFSRSAVPHDRDGSGQVQYLLHLGIYAYRAGFLKTFSALPPTPAEEAEKLEQLRVLQHGYRIAVAVVEYSGAGIDTPDDYAAFVRRTGKN
ncbi:MAG: 3-deoxy-manno-octulosonate cytidylyltransferase [Phycisphaerae bacterium]|nr:3-deoxy-manno-octulosonate cytidylyltransferase [Phycisphaerae bacterium]